MVLSIPAERHWKVKMSKYAFAQQQNGYLGHIVSGAGVATDHCIDTITSWPHAQTVKGARGFLGLTGYYRKIIKHYGIISHPLTELLNKHHIFLWTEVTEVAFQTLKQALITTQVLALPGFNKCSLWKLTLVTVVWVLFNAGRTPLGIC